MDDGPLHQLGVGWGDLLISADLLDGRCRDEARVQVC